MNRNQLANGCLVLLTLLLVACNSASDNDTGGDADHVKERFDELVSAVTSLDYSALYEVQVPPSKRQDCTEESFGGWNRQYDAANPLSVTARTNLFENVEFVRGLATGTDRITVTVENKLLGEQSSMDFIREEGEWYFRDPAFAYEGHPLFRCNPD